MAILDLIEFLDPTGEVLITREPQDSSGAFRYGSQLVVQEGQLAIFYKDGKPLDRFGPGRYTLSSKNLPLLGTLIGLAFGGQSPFRTYVYFISLKTFTNIGWGTKSPVIFRDADLRMVSLRANGLISIQINNAEAFLYKIVGTKGIETTFHLREFFRTLIVSHLNRALGTTMKSILDLPAQYGNIAEIVRGSVKGEFEQYGVELIDLIINAITVPPEVQEMVNRATGIAAQDPDKYKSIATADALRDAANNPGSAGQGMGAGLGLGMGLGMAREMAQSFAAAPARAPELATAAKTIAPEDLRPRLQELRTLKEEGLISDADFEQQKHRLLAKF